MKRTLTEGYITVECEYLDGIPHSIRIKDDYVKDEIYLVPKEARFLLSSLQELLSNQKSSSPPPDQL